MPLEFATVESAPFDIHPPKFIREPLAELRELKAAAVTSPLLARIRQTAPYISTFSRVLLGAIAAAWIVGASLWTASPQRTGAPYFLATLICISVPAVFGASVYEWLRLRRAWCRDLLAGPIAEAKTAPLTFAERFGPYLLLGERRSGAWFFAVWIHASITLFLSIQLSLGPAPNAIAAGFSTGSVFVAMAFGPLGFDLIEIVFWRQWFRSGSIGRAAARCAALLLGGATVHMLLVGAFFLLMNPILVAPDRTPLGALAIMTGYAVIVLLDWAVVMIALRKTLHGLRFAFSSSDPSIVGAR
jgi:hypothetical protein